MIFLTIYETYDQLGDLQMTCSKQKTVANSSIKGIRLDIGIPAVQSVSISTILESLNNSIPPPQHIKINSSSSTHLIFLNFCSSILTDSGFGMWKYE